MPDERRVKTLPLGQAGLHAVERGASAPEIVVPGPPAGVGCSRRPRRVEFLRRDRDRTIDGENAAPTVTRHRQGSTTTAAITNDERRGRIQFHDERGHRIPPQQRRKMAAPVRNTDQVPNVGRAQGSEHRRRFRPGRAALTRTQNHLNVQLCTTIRNAGPDDGTQDRVVDQPPVPGDRRAGDRKHGQTKR